VARKAYRYLPLAPTTPDAMQSGRQATLTPSTQLPQATPGGRSCGQTRPKHPRKPPGTPRPPFGERGRHSRVLSLKRQKKRDRDSLPPRRLLCIKAAALAGEQPMRSKKTGSRPARKAQAVAPWAGALRPMRPRLFETGKRHLPQVSQLPGRVQLADLAAGARPIAAPLTRLHELQQSRCRVRRRHDRCSPL
jgi:hypothetical protein